MSATKNIQITNISNYPTIVGRQPTPPLNPSSSPQPSLIPPILNQKGLHFLHANVRSLIPKLSELRLFLSKTKTSVFAATETWLDSSVNDGEIQISGFNVVRRDRSRNGGGVAMYIRDDIAYNPRPDLDVDGLESTWVELLLPKSKGILVCTAYRPPNDSSFLSKFESCLSKVEPGKEWYLLGDFNIDLLRRTSPMYSSYMELLSFFGCEQLIVEPTRVSSNSSSLIDHVITNVSELVQESGVVCSGFSDHFLTFCSRRIQKGLLSTSNTKWIRAMKCYSKHTFLNELSQLNWSSILSSSDVNFCLSEFARLFTSALDKVAPLREIRVKSKPNPWMNSTILAGIRERDRLLSRFKKDKTKVEIHREYCRVQGFGKISRYFCFYCHQSVELAPNAH